MFQPLSVFVGLRYVRARTHKFFVSFITWASLAGVCVGVAALIVILSVMNGLEGELRDRLLSLTSHARIVAKEDARVGPQDWSTAEGAVRGAEGVEGVAPYVEIPVLAVRAQEMMPVTLRGIDPRAEVSVTEVARSMVIGQLSDLVPGSDRVVVGEVVAQRLAVTTGDPVTVLVPATDEYGVPDPHLRELTVAGIFEVGLEDHDATLMFMHLDDVRALAGGAAAEGLRLRFHDALAVPAQIGPVRQALPESMQAIDWTQEHASYFRAIRIEKTMMGLILLLSVAVAGFNIVAMLVMVVTDKRTDIAILRTLGASPRRVMGVFITQGLVIGWLGVLLGVLLGVSLALNVDVVVPFLEQTFGFRFFDPDVYLFSEIPSDLQWPNVAVISVAALLLTGVAVIYPALRAARTAPADALRYE